MKTAICNPNNNELEIASIFQSPDPSQYPKNADGTDSAQAKVMTALIAAQATATQTQVPVADGVADDTHYIDATTHQAVKRPVTACTASATTTPADGTSTITLSGLATNTQIDIAGPVNSSFVNAAASEDLTFGAAGDYTITATAPFPALPTEVTVSAT